MYLLTVYQMVKRTNSLSCQVYFDFGSGFLYNSSAEYDLFENENMSKSNYYWLTEICLHKSENLPDLNTINIREELRGGAGGGCGSGRLTSSIRWLPPDVAVQFQDNGIKLDVTLRAGYASALTVTGVRMAKRREKRERGRQRMLQRNMA